jgi:hypothetical protein
MISTRHFACMQKLMKETSVSQQEQQQQQQQQL